jgi:hypothetical protein
MPKPKPADPADRGLEPNLRALWPTAQKAARMLGVSLRTVHNYIERGEIHCKIDSLGVKRLNPDEVAELMPAEQEATRSVLQTLAEETRGLLKLTTEPTRKLLELFSEHVERQNKRITDLESAHLATLKQYEEALSLAHERELARDVVRQQQARIDRGVKTLEEWLPKLASQAIGRTKVQKLIEGLQDEQLEMLKEIGAITGEQRELLAQIRDDAAAAKAKKETGNHDRKEPEQPPSGESGDGGDGGATQHADHE